MSKTGTRPPADQPARDRIRRDLTSNLLVEAGAGSGKTHELATRMAAGVADGVYELERMAAVTFTRKAAAELRGRFQLALESELRASSVVGVPDLLSLAEADSAREARIRTALANLERFFAGTIHAFCARLLRERPVEAGVSPGFTELDDVEDRLLGQQSWRDYRVQAKAAGDPDLLELLDAGLSAKQLDDAFERMCVYEDVTFPPGDAPMPDVQAAWAALAAFWQVLEPMLPVPAPPGSTCKTQERGEKFRRQWRARQRGGDSPALLADCLRTWSSQAKVTQRDWPSKVVAKEAEQLHAGFRERTVLPYLTAWRRYLYRRCVTLLSKARDAARLDRRRRNALSFSDLLILTAGVLRSNPGVRRALQDKYRWLFVDEFQDTDPVQAEIMFLLAADDAADDNWRTASLRPGALFVVGDPKQSIFRFRRADIDIYNEVRERLAPGLVKLTTSFRSVPGLCDWANTVFQTQFPPAPTPQAPMFAPLDAYRPGAPGLPPLSVIDLPADLDASEVAAEEASRIARYIRAEVDAGRRTFEDFLIITRKKKGLRPYASALEALQVPIEVTGAGAFGESDEVRALALLLAVLSDPQDAVALVGVLRGPLFGLSDRALFEFRQQGGWFSLFSDAATGPVADALAALRRWHLWTRRVPAGAALDRMLEDSGYLALGATSPGGVEAGDLLHAVDRVRAMLETGFTLADAAAALAAWCDPDEADIRESTEVDSLPLEPGRRDVVRLMNLHKAKGLEAKVVFLADPLGGFEPRVDVRIVREATDALGYFRITQPGNHAPVVLAEPENWDAHAAIEKEYLEAEQSRLLYVAATRAEDMLVVGRWAGKPGQRKRAWEMLTGHLTGAPALPVPPAVSSAPAAVVDLSDAAADLATRACEAAHGRVIRPSWSATSVTAESKKLQPRDDLPADETDPTRTILPTTPSHRADAGLAWGALVHGLLEHAMRHPAATRDDLRRLAMWLTVEEPALRPLIDRALDTVQSVANAGFWTDARAAAERHEEAPFAILDATDTSAVPRVITGTIDLVHRSADGWHVVDYKTDVDLADPAAQARYNEQVREYARAWGRVAKGKVTTAVVSTRAGS